MRVIASARPRIGELAQIDRLGPELGSALSWMVLWVIGCAQAIVGERAAPVDLLPVLFATAAGCTIALARPRAPSAAWLAGIAGTYAVAALSITVAGETDPSVVGLWTWLRWAVPAGILALATLWIAAGYATRPGRRLEPVALPLTLLLVAWFAAAIIVTVGAAFANARTDPAFNWVDVATAPIAWFRPLLAVLVALGVLADVRQAWLRATARTPAGTRAWEIAAATIRELVPGAAAAEDARAADERARLAGDLHAAVVPSLRRAIQEAETGADPAVVLGHLRSADLELERLMADRWPVILESFGLLAALEDLAERLEAGGSPPITIDVATNDGRPVAPVERAAWQFALITLDNAVRHASAGSIAVSVAVGPARVHLAVTDDGAGFDTAAGRRQGARGIADVSGRAGAIGASVGLSSSPGSGTVATFDWTA